MRRSGFASSLVDAGTASRLRQVIQRSACRPERPRRLPARFAVRGRVRLAAYASHRPEFDPAFGRRVTTSRCTGAGGRSPCPDSARRTAPPATASPAGSSPASSPRNATRARAAGVLFLQVIRGGSWPPAAGFRSPGPSAVVQLAAETPARPRPVTPTVNPTPVLLVASPGSAAPDLEYHTGRVDARRDADQIDRGWPPQEPTPATKGLAAIEATRNEFMLTKERVDHHERPEDETRGSRSRLRSRLRPFPAARRAVVSPVVVHTRPFSRRDRGTVVITPIAIRRRTRVRRRRPRLDLRASAVPRGVRRPTGSGSSLLYALTWSRGVGRRNQAGTGPARAVRRRRPSPPSRPEAGWPRDVALHDPRRGSSNWAADRSTFLMILSFRDFRFTVTMSSNLGRPEFIDGSAPLGSAENPDRAVVPGREGVVVRTRGFQPRSLRNPVVAFVMGGRPLRSGLALGAPGSSPSASDKSAGSSDVAVRRCRVRPWTTPVSGPSRNRFGRRADGIFVTSFTPASAAVFGERGSPGRSSEAPSGRFVLRRARRGTPPMR